MTGEEDPLTYLQRPLFERASEDVVEALLQHGADPNATTTKPHPLPPLLMATKLHLPAGVTASLLRHGARPDVGVAWSTSKISNYLRSLLWTGKFELPEDTSPPDAQVVHDTWPSVSNLARHWLGW